jgi:hypothetical protein
MVPGLLSGPWTCGKTAVLDSNLAKPGGVRYGTAVAIPPVQSQVVLV